MRAAKIMAYITRETFETIQAILSDNYNK